MTREELINSKEYLQTSIEVQIYDAFIKHFKTSGLSYIQYTEKYKFPLNLTKKICKGNLDLKLSELVQVVKFLNLEINLK